MYKLMTKLCFALVNHYKLNVAHLLLIRSERGRYGGHLCIRQQTLFCHVKIVKQTSYVCECIQLDTHNS